MGQADRLSEVFVETQRPSHGPTHLVDVDRVRHSSHEMVPVRVKEHLGLVLQPAKRLAVDDAITIPLKAVR